MCSTVVHEERMADLYVQYERTPYFDRQSGMSLEVCLPCCDSAQACCAGRAEPHSLPDLRLPCTWLSQGDSALGYTAVAPACPRVLQAFHYVNTHALTHKHERQEYHTTIERSCCLYVGNLSYFTTEAQIYDFFNRAGEVKRVVMGLDKFQKTPCGFCFVEYYTVEDTEAAIRYLNGMRLDDRQIRLDRDPGAYYLLFIDYILLTYCLL